MQTVKINAGFSEKTSENYNSTQHSISLEMDIQVNGNTRDLKNLLSTVQFFFKIPGEGNWPREFWE